MNQKLMNCRLVVFAVMVFAINNANAQDPVIDIRLSHNDTLEIQTKFQLQKLMKQYDLSKWLFTNTVQIESGNGVIPHSHPVLTLSTRHLKDDDLLLSTFIHEEFHWYINSNLDKNQLLSDLKTSFPEPKIAFPEGSGGIEDTYFHIIICHLEYKLLRRLLGELKAFNILSF